MSSWPETIRTWHGSIPMPESVLKRLRYRTADILRKAAKRVAPTGNPGVTFPDIGIEKLPKNAPRALVIYVVAGAERWLRGVPLDDPFFSRHSMYWESVEMVRQLNAHGYVVDYADKRSPVTADWSRYTLVIDQWDNLRHIPPQSGQAKIHYTTYTHWLSWNLGEHTRIRWFRERTGITVPWVRTMPPIMSDEHADYLTYFGTQTQIDSFSQKPQKHQLNISAAHLPTYLPKNIDATRKNFLWIGGGGMVHKGLDIAMEAFIKTPELNLFIAGNPQQEPEFWKWAGPFIAHHRNIHLLGWVDIASSTFDAIARDCIGVVYPSAAEGGPGSVAQVLHWGLIPIVTKSALVRAETLGRVIGGKTDYELIESTMDSIRAVTSSSASELARMSSAVTDFAHHYHTRSAYSQSFEKLLTTIL